MTKNQNNIKSMIGEFRKWTVAWDNYKGINAPDDLDEFAITLSKKWKISQV